MSDKSHISSWIENRLAEGLYSFSVDTLRKELNNKSDISIKRGLLRLSKQKKVNSVHQGFYIIIPPAYRNMGTLPAVMFIDDLMNHLNRSYYISLLSAAALHGAAHQQPQKTYICTTIPSLRSTAKEGISIKYISRRRFPSNHIIKRKTESGYVRVSDPLLTCIDLINYQKTIGGLNRAATIIYELSEDIDLKQIDDAIFEIATQVDLQRLGYLWEYEVEQVKLSDQLFSLLLNRSIKLRSTKLISNKPKSEKSLKNRWKVEVNAKIEIDE